ncbi:MAG TPA: phosphatidylglycerophosphatase A [Candidatus Acidoferrales bacterium]|nr:phosphatidylglycerophosphatase A [Candidatus Acidoferrales bacterium]
MTAKMTANADAKPDAADATAGAAAQHMPRFAIRIATVFGLGNIPLAPGTWGSLAGVLIAWANISLARSRFMANEVWCVFAFAVIGVWAAGRAARHLGKKDPQNIVIDEVSGQSIAFLGLLAPGPLAHYWQYLLVGFILFRVFDIWKPFPARQAEWLRGGWGIMADDWIAGGYAALGLWIARAAGL